jgi:hypothetical protein
MPDRLRDRYLTDVFEALIQYSHEGGELRLHSVQEDDRLVVEITLDDNDAYQAKLSQVMNARPGLERGAPVARASSPSPALDASSLYAWPA